METSNDAVNSYWQVSNNYPIIYPVMNWVRIAIIVFALFFCGLWTRQTFQPAYDSGWTIAIPPIMLVTETALLLAFACMIWWSFTAKIVLHEDSYEQRNPLRSRVIRVADIKGLQTTQKGGYPLLVLNSGRMFSIDTGAYRVDSRFDMWLSRLPDLAQIAVERERIRVRDDSSLGATVSERIANNAKRQTAFIAWSWVLSLTSIAIFFAGRFGATWPALLTVAAVLPLCCLLLGRIYKDQLESPDNRRTGSLVAMPLLLPIFSLAMWATTSAKIFDSSKAIIAGAVVGLPFWLLLIALLGCQAKAMKGKILFALIFAPYAWVYGGSVLALGNNLLDHAPVQIYQTRVLDKYLVRSKGGSEHYLRLASWGPAVEGSRLMVDRAWYDSAQQGDIVCMGIHPGKFGVRWTHSVTCPATSDSAATDRPESNK